MAGGKCPLSYVNRLTYPISVICFIWGMKPSYETLVDSIYDCAANPALWPDALSHIRDAVDAAYVGIRFADFSSLATGISVKTIRYNSPWDEAWLDQHDAWMGKIPYGQVLFKLPLDVSWTQLKQIPEEEFQQTEFYREWVKPQNLRDCLSLNYLKQDQINGILTMPTSAKRAPVSSDNCRLAEQLSPHIRRAININDLTEQGNLATRLYRQVLDTLSVAAFVVGPGRRLVFTNAAGDTLLSEGDKLHAVGGVLHGRRLSCHASALDDAVDAALNGIGALGTAGIGVPLIGEDGDRAAAYVLPLNRKNKPSDLGSDNCAIFVARRGEHHPLATEMLRSMFGLTVSEARVALMIAKGENPQMISAALGIKVNTVRTHLKHCFAKIDAPDQIAMAGCINAVLPPFK
jgi:DNA-binding CsgD family transcriptional regulator